MKYHRLTDRGLRAEAAACQAAQEAAQRCAAALAGATLHKPTDRPSLEAVLVGTVGTSGLHLVHVRTDASINVRLHREAARAVDHALFATGVGR